MNLFPMQKLEEKKGSFSLENEGVSESTHGGVVWYEMRLKF